MNYNNGPNSQSTDNSRITTTTTTTNHIYLHPGPNQSEFDNWMRQVGSLLHIAAEHSRIKPILDLLIAAIEPERIFLLSYPAITAQNIKGGIELILIVDKINYPIKSVFSFVKLTCFKTSNLIVSVHSSSKMERGLSAGHPYYSTHCTEENLIFSGNSYRLLKTHCDLIDRLKIEVSEIFHEGINKATELFELANDLEKKARYNQAALMLHQCAEQVYRTVLLSIGQHIPSYHRLEKLERKAAYFMPQIYDIITDKSNLEILNSAYESHTLHRFEMEDLCDISILSADVKNLLQLSSIIFEDKKNRMFGITGELKNKLSASHE